MRKETELARPPGNFRLADLCLFAGAAIFFVFSAIRSRGPLWGDDAVYLGIARSLAHGGGYSFMGIPHSKYPPGLPLTLAGIEILFPGSVLAARLLIAILGAAAVWLTYRFLRKSEGEAVAFTVAVLTGLCPIIAELASRPMTEVPYTAVSLACLLSPSVTLAAAAVLIRLPGVTLGLGIAAGTLFESSPLTRRRVTRAVLFAAVPAILLGIWLLRAHRLEKTIPPELGEEHGYASELLVTNPDEGEPKFAGLSDLVLRIRNNLPRYRDDVVALAVGRVVWSRWRKNLLAAAWLVSFVYSLIRRRGAAEFYLLSNLAMLAVWPGLQTERHLAPVVPLILLYAFRPLFGAVRWISGRIRVSRQVPVAAFSGLLILLHASFAARKKREDFPGEANYVEVINWSRNHLPKTTVLVADRAPAVSLLSERRAFPFPWLENREAVLASMERHRASYVLVDESRDCELYLRPVIREHPERFREIHRSGASGVYQLSPR